MQPSTISTAAREYAHRPEDERFDSLRALIQDAETDRDLCAEKIYNLRDLRITPTSTDREQRTGPNAAGILLTSPNGQATLTHYSFGQLLKSIGTEYSRGAALLRSLPAQEAADVLNYGLHEHAPHGTRANILIRDNPDQPFPVVRAATSETYGRLWDGPFYGEVDRWFGDGKHSNGGAWQTPPVWPGAKPGGNYRGDRDSFVIRVDGGSIVTDPRSAARSANGTPVSTRGDGRLYRGIMLRNSEVGECSVSIECVLFDFICGNHYLWGAIIDRKYRRRHVGKDKITRDTMNELIKLARDFNQRTASQDEAIIHALVTHEIAKTKDGVIDELTKLGYTKKEATEAYGTAEAQEDAFSPRSFWGIAAGTTRNSQDSGHQDERLALDQLAAAVLKAGQRQYVTV